MNVVFNLSSAGTWVLSNSLTPETSSYVVENIEYNKTLSNVPDGKTVLPTDDIQTWLNCADICDKEYTTLAEVLADKDTLVKLMASDNAVDYLVRSETWAESVALVPIMTDNTHPSGTCTAVANMSDAYKCFDGDDSTYWYNNGEGSAENNYVEYDFPSLIEYEKVTISAKSSSNTAGSWDIVLKKYVNDEWVESGSMTTPSIVYSGGVYSYSFDVTCGSTDKLRIYSERSNDSEKRGSLMIHSLQFYSASIATSETAMQAINASDYASDTLLANATWCEAICNSEYSELVLNASVPVMTSNTTPKGECFAENFTSGNPAYYAFNQDISNYWVSSELNTASGIGYTFTGPVAVYLIEHTTIGGNSVYFNATVQSSDDGSTYTNVLSVPEFYTNTTTSRTDSIILSNVTSKQYWKIHFDAKANVKAAVPILQFYGRQPGGVQTWLHKAGITDKNYTTLAEVLNDTATLALLMANEDAVDYLVTCKGWATAQALIPTMTSNTTPSGIASASSQHSSGNLNAFRAFDNNDTTMWAVQDGATSHPNLWIKYEFENPVCVGKVRTLFEEHVSAINANVQGSNDDSTWTNIGTLSTVGEATTVCSNDEEYKYYRLYITSQTTNVSTYGGRLYTLQFYSSSIADSEVAMQYIGQNNYAANTLLADETWCNAICNSEYFESVLNAKVPIMTSDTAPSGEVIYSTQGNTDKAYYAFNGDSSNYWSSNGTCPQYLGYGFGRLVCVINFYMKSRTYYTGHSHIPLTFKLQGSNDNSIWNNVESYTNPSGGDQGVGNYYTNSNFVKYNYWRVYALTSEDNENVAILELQFYGREDV